MENFHHPLPGLCYPCTKSPPPWDRLITISGYEFPFREILQRFKYQNSTAWAIPLAKMLEVEIYCNYSAGKYPKVVIPMPVHNRKLLERGFNQSTLLAKPICKALGLRLVSSLARKTRHTTAQASLPLKERQLNVAGSFSVKGNLDGADVAVVEDTVTTGATLDALCGELRRANAGEIHVWCIARTSPVKIQGQGLESPDAETPDHHGAGDYLCARPFNG